jgi:predicted transcriptional regulator
LFGKAQFKKASIAKILKRMIRKDLIRKGRDGRYYPLVTKQEVAFSRIDRSRVRIQQP